MENYLMLGTQRIELSKELAAGLRDAVQAAKDKESGPFGRVEGGACYFYILYNGKLSEVKERECRWDDAAYAVANYCTDKELMEQRALHETLNRLLWRYSEQHGGDLEWGPIEMDHYSICRDTLNDRWTILVSATTKYPGVVYFKDKKTAQKAVEEIVEPFMADHPEFVW